MLPVQGVELVLESTGPTTRASICNSNITQPLAASCLNTPANRLQIQIAGSHSRTAESLNLAPHDLANLIGFFYREKRAGAQYGKL